MLTVVSFRSEEIGGKPFLSRLLERADGDVWTALSLEPMTETKPGTLVGALLPAESPLTRRPAPDHP